jgi:hypothetical protein
MNEKKNYFIFSLLLSLIVLNSCTQEKKLITKVNNLKSVKKMPYIPELSGDSLFWVIIEEKKDIIPFLIEKLDDTTKTVAEVPNFGGYYTVADVSYSAIQKIIHGIPTIDLVTELSTSNVRLETGYGVYWSYVRDNLTNRKAFKSKIKEWYFTSKDDLKWVEYTHKFRSASDWKFKKNKHPTGGYYKLEADLTQY